MTMTAKKMKADPDTRRSALMPSGVITWCPRFVTTTRVSVTIVDDASTARPKIQYEMAPKVLLPRSSIVEPMVRSQRMLGGFMTVSKRPRENGVPTVRRGSATEPLTAALMAEAPNHSKRAAPAILKTPRNLCRTIRKPTANEVTNSNSPVKTPSTIIIPVRRPRIPSFMDRKNTWPGTRKMINDTPKT